MTKVWKHHKMSQYEWTIASRHLICSLSHVLIYYYWFSASFFNYVVLADTGALLTFGWGLYGQVSLLFIPFSGNLIIYLMTLHFSAWLLIFPGTLSAIDCSYNNICISIVDPCYLPMAMSICSSSWFLFKTSLPCLVLDCTNTENLS